MTSMKTKKDYYTVADCVRQLGISRQRVHQHIKSGNLAVRGRQGKLLIIDAQEFKRFIAELQRRRKRYKVRLKRKTSS